MSNDNQTDQTLLTLDNKYFQAIEDNVGLNSGIALAAKQCTAISLSFAIETLENIGWPTLWSEIQKLKEQLNLIKQG